MELKPIGLVRKMEQNNPNLEYFEQGIFTMKLVYVREPNVIKMEISLLKPLSSQVWNISCMRLIKLTHCSADLHIIAEKAEAELLEVLSYIGRLVSRHMQLRIFHESLPVINEQKCPIYQILNEQERDQAIQNKHLLQEFLEHCGFQLEIHVEEMKKSALIPTVTVKSKAAAKPVRVYEERRSYNFKPKGKKGLDQYVPFSTHNITEECHDIRIHGKTFRTETRALHNGRDIQMLWIGDNDDTIITKRFERGVATKEALAGIKNGDCVVTYGKAEYNAYTQELVSMPGVIGRVAEVKRMDETEEKHIELCVHTKSSEMGGVYNIEEYIDQVNAWGMDTIATTDRLVVQAFPEAQHKMEAVSKGRKAPFEMTYGLKMSMVGPALQVVHNIQDIKPEEGTYHVFDLETTGLSNRSDHIIEFGGQIVKDRAYIKGLQLFIKPPVALGVSTTGLTNIMEEHMKSVKSSASNIDEILDFVGDSILVMHNAAFDYNFLNDELARIGRPPIMNPMINTLDLVRGMQADRKGCRLGQIARSYGIRYDEDVTRCADYGAEVLAQTYMNMLNDLKHIKNLQELQGMQTAESFRKVRVKHVTILAKNMAGLKELFELVTLSHTSYLAYGSKSTDNIIAEPRILRSGIEKRCIDGNLPIGSGCLNGEVFGMAQARNEQTLEETIQFYDYMELQPLESYRYLVERDPISSMERLKEILTCIMKVADKLDKLLVASRDCHYAQPGEKMIRDIYISSQTIGGVRHPPYMYNQEKRRKFKAPDQRFRTTKETLKEFIWLGE